MAPGETGISTVSTARGFESGPCRGLFVEKCKGCRTRDANAFPFIRDWVPRFSWPVRQGRIVPVNHFWGHSGNQPGNHSMEKTRKISCAGNSVSEKKIRHILYLFGNCLNEEQKTSSGTGRPEQTSMWGLKSWLRATAHTGPSRKGRRSGPRSALILFERKSHGSRDPHNESSGQGSRSRDFRCEEEKDVNAGLRRRCSP